jgi:hypothetical protein
MDEGEFPHPQHLPAHGYPCRLIPVLMQNIMVALDQPDSQIRKIVPPPPEQIQLLVLPTVKQIPDNQQLPRLKILDQGE